ncbi:hypothetical protein D3H35_19545 [Cohnella faecalis]|uniref:Uncharacterized protein n=1 Tax=Cohnella faecalis TaxID=2315694 RepID=A0A398CQ02_9BACL|nr:hypothetical protein D3H35_19545 [Cohnella faecalis]
MSATTTLPGRTTLPLPTRRFPAITEFAPIVAPSPITNAPSVNATPWARTGMPTSSYRWSVSDRLTLEPMRALFPSSTLFTADKLNPMPQTQPSPIIIFGPSLSFRGTILNQ